MMFSSPWVAGSASSKPIGNNERLRAFNQARRTWAAAIRAAALVASAPVAAAHHSANKGALSDEARAELREAFDGLDVEGIWPRPNRRGDGVPPETATRLRGFVRAGNGTISFEELAGVMASLGHGEEALAVFKEVSRRFEFCAAMGNQSTPSTAALDARSTYSTPTATRG